jgi:dienelactone hydrolase
MTWWRHAAVAAIGLAILITACSSPARQFARRAESLGLHAEVVSGLGFQHVVYREARRPSRTLHVYLDGDGTPWRGGLPASDPTPRAPLVLDLMALDPTPSLYLGRPCYHGLAETPPCGSALWTHARYSEAVVSSMAAALRRVLATGDYDRLVWLGYSGGGTLAVLLAPRFPETMAVVTVAANLDIDAWADFHGYSRLTESLNPATQPPLPGGIYQRHYAGGQDRVVPRDIVARGARRPETLVVIPTYNHICCWTALWPTVVADLERVTAASPSR